MFILTAQQTREWDAFTIEREPIDSFQLMQRAAAKCAKWILAQQLKTHCISVFCGRGNNGGDGLLLACILQKHNYNVSVYILENKKPGSIDFEKALLQAAALNVPIKRLSEEADFPAITPNEIVVDALFGSGLHSELQGVPAQLVDHINRLETVVISIDVPSGLFIDRTSKGQPAVRASITLTFQTYKLALLMQENAPFIGQVQLLDIGLHPAFLDIAQPKMQFTDAALVKHLFRHRNAFAHKGNYGHALLVAGAFGKMGAAVLTTKACLRAGAGLTTVHVPACGYQLMQLAAPEAMVLTDTSEQHVSTLPDEMEKYNTLGVGPGMGTSEDTKRLFSFLVRRCAKPMVLDADALNCLALDPTLLHQLPPQSVLTPHPKEFDRLFGAHNDDFARMETAVQKALELNIIIVLKSHHTLVASSGGLMYFNGTGNAGMAKGGSGDVLTGIITALVAQGYDPLHAAIVGVYIHGAAGDVAAQQLSKESMLATDIINYLGEAFKQLY
jgi:NAD(P)H-hydrate epimerase